MAGIGGIVEQLLPGRDIFVVEAGERRLEYEFAEVVDPLRLLLLVPSELTELARDELFFENSPISLSWNVIRQYATGRREANTIAVSYASCNNTQASEGTRKHAIRLLECRIEW